jgi:hypothetical protein
MTTSYLSTSTQYIADYQKSSQYKLSILLHVHTKNLWHYVYLSPKPKYSNINLQETRRGKYMERKGGCQKGKKLSSQAIGLLFHVKSLCVFKS